MKRGLFLKYVTLFVGLVTAVLVQVADTVPPGQASACARTARRKPANSRPRRRSAVVIRAAVIPACSRCVC